MVVPADIVGIRRTKYGFEWRYEHVFRNMPDETFRAIVRTCAEVAVREARTSGKNYVVASTPLPSAAIYVLAADHPKFAQNPALKIRYEFSPEGELVRYDETISTLGAWRATQH